MGARTYRWGTAYPGGYLLVAVTPRWWGYTVALLNEHSRPVARHQLIRFRRPHPDTVAAAYLRYLTRITTERTTP